MGREVVTGYEYFCGYIYSEEGRIRFGNGYFTITNKIKIKKDVENFIDFLKNELQQTNLILLSFTRVK